MARPFRHYCFMMSEKLGVYVHDLMNDLSSAQIAEYMAFDQLKDSEYRAKLKRDAMTQEELTMVQKALFGFKGA